MIYLLESSYYKRDESGKIEFGLMYKIGYTSDNNLVERRGSYISHNPSITLLYEIPGGTEDHEKRLHYKFRDLLLYGNEWFKHDPSILRYFESKPTLESIESLPKNPTRGDKKHKGALRDIRKILGYLLPKSDIEEFMDSLDKELGDKLSVDTFFEYIKGSNLISEEKLENYFRISNNISTSSYSDSEEVNREVIKFMNEYSKLTTIFDRLKFICESQVSEEVLEVFLNQLSDSDDVKSYYQLLGKDKLRALSYNTGRIKKELKVITFNPLVLENIIYQDFHEGDRVPIFEIKEKLSEIYESIGYRRTAKAVDIMEFFEVKIAYITRKLENSEESKQYRGYELLKKRR